jgi:tetratricopeptide (TPR) repeat protein
MTPREREGRLADAVAHFSRAATLRPADARIRTDLDRALARQGRPDEAARELQIAVRLDPGFADARLTLGGVLFAEGRTEEALARYRAAARLHPDSAAIHYNLAQALAGLGRSPRPPASTGPRSRSSRGSPTRARAWSSCFSGWGRRARARTRDPRLVAWICAPGRAPGALGRAEFAREAREFLCYDSGLESRKRRRRPPGHR